MIVLSYQPGTDTPLIVLANRDEFWRRRAAPLAWSPDYQVLAGKDLGYRSWRNFWRTPATPLGTWLGVSRSGRFAAITNFREPGHNSHNAKSRGLIVSRFLKEDISYAAYSEELARTAHDYNGYNLLFGDSQTLYYFSNRANAAARQLVSGVYGLSNALLDAPWHKVNKAKADLVRLKNSLEINTAFELMHDTMPAPDDAVQQTGLPFAVEKALSSAFIRLPGYGTRATSFLRFRSDGRAEFSERTYHKGKFVFDTRVEFSITK
ncbi:MAG: NRDE family protein [Spirochaetes bacterium]|nr:NRDE family protein [Spirochaetota bacterium]